MAGIVGAGSRIGAQMRPVLKKRAEQGAAAIAGSKGLGRTAPPPKPSDPTKSGILGTMRSIAQRKTGRGGKMSKR